VRIYLDNCAYNRPFDDQKSIKIQLETSAKLYIQEQIRRDKYDYTEWHKDLWKDKSIDEIHKMGMEFEKLKIKPREAKNR